MPLSVIAPYTFVRGITVALRGSVTFRLYAAIKRSLLVCLFLLAPRLTCIAPICINISCLVFHPHGPYTFSPSTPKWNIDCDTRFISPAFIQSVHYSSATMPSKHRFSHMLNMSAASAFCQRHDCFPNTCSLARFAFFCCSD